MKYITLLFIHFFLDEETRIRKVLKSNQGHTTADE